MAEGIKWEYAGFDCEIFIEKNGLPKGFEVYDINDPENYHVEGMLEMEDNNVIGYDGCYELPDVIEVKLEELGYNCSEL